MKTKINLTVPKSWHELSDDQLRFVYAHIASDATIDELKVLCLLHWNNIKVEGRQKNGAYILRQGKLLFEVKPLTIAELLTNLNWIVAIPTTPIRPSTIQGNKALPADFREVPFETYIVCDNLYQGFLQTQNVALLDQLASVLYGKEIKLAPWEHIAIFYWMASLKDFLSRRYRDFFQPLDNGGNALGNAANAVEEAMNAQIRALTKGDITKEKDILAMDTWRALTELNAQAREYREFNAKLSSHGK